jgi:hypothetical protein
MPAAATPTINAPAQSGPAGEKISALDGPAPTNKNVGMTENKGQTAPRSAAPKKGLLAAIGKMLNPRPIPHSAESPIQDCRQLHAVAQDLLSQVEAPPLTELELRHSRLIPSRELILPLLPKGGVCAEVGTQTGYFAKLILSVLQPVKLHLFDIDFTPFDHVHFQPAIQQKIVQLHQGDSATRLSFLPDRYLDFIYIDADHSYASVVRDLEQAALKIKEGGWIVCNDYTVYSPLEGALYGVCRAVNEFCLQRGYEIRYLGLHRWGYHDVALKKRLA